ncbi:MAG: hypothetical protein A2X94_01685 [Bdellovibrionales bacterium GWB1_55_8]|nr:MAG: hypothetical protein A2X94_01685 [Bdellovibrionales bacterium GWB1_55_8]
MSKFVTKTSALWAVALVFTLGTALYQRWSGPTYPLRGKIELGASAGTRYKLKRSQGGSNDHIVEIPSADPAVTGFVQWKRFKTSDDWTIVPLRAEQNVLRAPLPGQPPAGKLEYRVTLAHGDKIQNLPETGTVVIRFKGEVPSFVLVPHIIFMFLALLLSARTGLETIRTEPKLKNLTLATLCALSLGGMLLGPLVQKYAFGAYWTGFPFGHDLTDNKTLFAFLGWVAGLYGVHRASRPKAWVLGAVLVMFSMYLIPHSMMGSELDYNKIDAEKQSQLKLVQ